MDHAGFWTVAGPFALAEIAAHAGAEIPPGMDAAAAHPVTAVKPIDSATSSDVSFFDNRKYLPQLPDTKAAAVFLSRDDAGRLPSGAIPLIAAEPYRAFAKVLELFYPDAGYTKVAGDGGEGAQYGISPTARLEEGVIVEAGAIVGPEAQIGRGTRIAAGAVVGYRVAIGRECYIGAQATVVHALVGNRVIVHAGVRIGQDGFGFAMGRSGHYKVRQVGRVIIQDDVEIGANTTIDRGALRDTIVGEGTKIDNLVQIAHNVVIGRHCVIAAMTGISGSTELEDFVIMGGQSGTVGHIRIGAGAQIGGQCGLASDVPPGQRWSGTPGRPIVQWARELALLKRLALRKKAGPSFDGAGV